MGSVLKAKLDGKIRDTLEDEIRFVRAKWLPKK